jgi:hypothetical protein
MKNLLCAVVLIMFAATQSPSLQKAEPLEIKKSSRIQLIETGDFHGSDMPAKSSKGWLGLYKTGKGFALIETTIKVQPTRDAVVDEDENEKTGKEVSVNHSTEPLFLVKGAAMLKGGSAATVLSGEKDLLNNKTISLRLAGKDYHLKVIANKRKSNPLAIREDARLVLTRGKTMQVLDVFGNDTEAGDPYWGLLWAGDLDNDGKLDLYLDVRWRYNISQHILFLSSPAGKGRIVKQIAHMETKGC